MSFAVNRSGLINISDKKPVGKTGWTVQSIRYSGVDYCTSSPGARPSDSFVKIFNPNGKCVDTALTLIKAKAKAKRLAASLTKGSTH